MFDNNQRERLLYDTQHIRQAIEEMKIGLRIVVVLLVVLVFIGLGSWLRH
jgi:hypothetical protein